MPTKTHTEQAPSSEAPADGYVDERGLSAYLNVPVQTIRGWRKRKRGEGPRAVKFGRLVRYRWEDIRAWEAQRPAA